MKEELAQLNLKMDALLAEMKELKASLSGTRRPPATVKYTVTEAAAYLRLSVPRVYELVYTGKLQPIQRKKYSRLLFSADVLNHFLHNGTKPTPIET